MVNYRTGGVREQGNRFEIGLKLAVIKICHTGHPNVLSLSNLKAVPLGIG